MHRRRFFRDSLLLGTGLAAGSDAAPPPRRDDPRLRVGLAAYSFRQGFGWMKGARRRVTGRAIDMKGFVDLCRDHGCAAELTSYFFPGDTGVDDLLALRRHAFARGVAISGTAVGNDFALPAGDALDRQVAYVKTWIDHAAVLGAPHVRVFAGTGKGMDLAAARRSCVKALEECCDHAGKRGVFLGLENHGGIVATAEGLLAIVQAVKSRWLGINLDTGNFHTADPYADLVRCAPFAVNVQVKVEMRAQGDKAAVPADLARVVRILRGAEYQGYVVLEYEAAEDPWRAVPRHLAALRKAIG